MPQAAAGQNTGQSKSGICIPIYNFDANEVASTISVKKERSKKRTRQRHAAKAPKAPRTVFPIQNLPVDLLAKVFTLCLPDSSDNHKAISKLAAPLQLCNVSSSWRALAISTPQLWSTFVYIFDGGPWTRRRRFDRKRILECIHTWLGRSGALPLTIQFAYLTCFGVTVTGKRVLSAIRAALAAFTQYASRWQRVILFMDVNNSPFPWPKTDVMPLLRCYDSVGLEGLPFTSAPLLTKLELDLESLSSFPILTDSIPWHQLTDLKIQTDISLSSAIAIIQSSPSLELLMLSIGDIEWDVVPRLPPEIEHINLRQLFLTTSSLDCGPLIESLTLPSLVDFNLGFQSEYVLMGHYSSGKQLASLFGRSNCKLQKLKLVDCGFEPEEILECIKHDSCQTLTQLSIINHEDAPIVNDETLEALTRVSDSKDGPICPRLAHLTFQLCVPTNCTPGWLGHMILSRLGRSEDSLESFQYGASTHLFPEDAALLLQAQTRGLYVDLQIKSDPVCVCGHCHTDERDYWLDLSDDDRDFYC